MNLQPPPNATLVERIIHYTDTEQHTKCRALCTLGDFLEECYEPELTFYDDEEELRL